MRKVLQSETGNLTGGVTAGSTEVETKGETACDKRHRNIYTGKLLTSKKQSILTSVSNSNK
jgi:hypothetical protein